MMAISSGAIVFFFLYMCLFAIYTTLSMNSNMDGIRHMNGIKNDVTVELRQVILSYGVRQTLIDGAVNEQLE